MYGAGHRPARISYYLRKDFYEKQGQHGGKDRPPDKETGEVHIVIGLELVMSLGKWSGWPTGQWII